MTNGSKLLIITLFGEKRWENLQSSSAVQMGLGMRDDLWEDLVLAILSVNRYSLEKTYSHVESLRREGLFDPNTLAKKSVEDIATRLRRGGYDRGEFLNALLATRLVSLGMFIERVGTEEAEHILAKGNTTQISKFLGPVKGIGPQVLANFETLRHGS